MARIHKVSIVIKRSGDEARQIGSEILRHLRDRGCEVVADASLALPLGLEPAAPEDLRAVQLCVVVGGDGTLIRAVRLLAGAEVPIFGVNAGSLGFLTEIPRGQAIELLDETLRGEAPVEHRNKLRVRLLRGGRQIVDEEVLNDAVISRGAFARMVELKTRIDGADVTSYKADGLIIASPTGSTAYSLAAQGPLLHPSMEAIVVNPICPHSLSQRALVVPDRGVVEVELHSAQGEILLSLDGQSTHSLDAGDRVLVDRAPHRALLVKNPQLDFFAVLRAKLRWGER
jgi:NAD+ kinase